MRILVTGGSGALGRRLLTQSAFAGDELFAPTHAELDVTDAQAVARCFERHAPELVVHAAAVISARSQDSAEHKRRTSLVNIAGTAHVARASARIGARLVYISTDFVFAGDKPGGLYREDDVPAPLGYYALTKLGGEAVLADHPNAMSVRISFSEDGQWPYPGAFVDRFTSKLPASIAAREIALAAKSGLTGPLHIGGPRQSFFEYARPLRADVAPITVASLNSPDPMPIDTSLDTRRWQAERARLGHDD